MATTHRLALGVGGLAAFSLLSAATATARMPPHILLVNVDDLGWGNVGFHRHGRDGHPANHRGAPDEVQTPTLDALVAEGVSSA